LAAIHDSNYRTRRIQTLALLALSIFLLSGVPAVDEPSVDVMGGTARAAASSAQPVGVALTVERSLRHINPGLEPRERARIGAAIDRYSAQYGLDPDLVLAIVLVESDARPWAHSPAGAVGLMQVMPHMMQPMGLAGNFATIESNIEAGCRILADNIRRLGVERGISAYFWGSDIRGVAYLEKVLEARERVRGLRTS
jgi:hypothetical protein